MWSPTTTRPRRPAHESTHRDRRSNVPVPRPGRTRARDIRRDRPAPRTGSTRRPGPTAARADSCSWAYRKPVRVMTWNVYWRFGGDWREREPAILATVDAYRPDVLGLVETWAGEGTSQPARIAGPRDMHAAYARTSLPPEPDPVEYPDQAGITVGIGLVSRWPILGTEVHDLPHEQRGGDHPPHC